MSIHNKVHTLMVRKWKMFSAEWRGYCSMCDNLWNVLAHMFWIFFSETVWEIYQLKVSWSHTARWLAVSGTACSKLCGSESQLTSWKSGTCEVRPSVLPQFPKGPGPSSSCRAPGRRVHGAGPPFCLSLATHHLFHREANINISEVAWTIQEGQSWDNYSYPTDVQLLTFPDESITNSVWWKYHIILVFASLQCHSRWQIQK